MTKFIELIEKVYPSKSQSKPMSDIFEVLDDHLEAICIKDFSTYSDVIEEMCIIVHGPYFNADTATKAVAAMKNEDGTFGQKVSMDESNIAASELGITFDKFTVYDWYYVMNMIYSDFCVVLGPDNKEVYKQLAKAFIMDSDAPIGKAFLYYKAMTDL